jgi:hypothetical protein
MCRVDHVVTMEAAARGNLFQVEGHPLIIAISEMIDPLRMALRHPHESFRFDGGRQSRTGLLHLHEQNTQRRTTD